MITRAEVEALLVQRTGNLLTFVGLDGTTIAGSNPSLNDPIGFGVRRLGGTVTSAVLVTDADVATVDDDDLDAFLIVTELRTLYNIQGNLSVVDVIAGPFAEKLSQVSQYIERQIRHLEKLLEEVYGIGGPELQVGVITRDIASHDEDPPT
jgi:hypothetical protein